jgi:hypothetical protein
VKKTVIFQFGDFFRKNGFFSNDYDPTRSYVPRCDQIYFLVIILLAAAWGT